MTNTGTITLQADSVNSGIAIVLNANTCTYNYKNNIRTDPIASGYTKVEAEHRGLENPVIQITGIIRDDANANEVTEILLKEFAKVKNEQLTLKIIWGSTGNEAVFTDADGNNTTNDKSGMPVIIESFDIDIDPTSISQAHVLRYNLSLFEDKV